MPPHLCYKPAKTTWSPLRYVAYSANNILLLLLTFSLKSEWSWRSQIIYKSKKTKELIIFYRWKLVGLLCCSYVGHSLLSLVYLIWLICHELILHMWFIHNGYSCNVSLCICSFMPPPFGVEYMDFFLSFNDWCPKCIFALVHCSVAVICCTRTHFMFTPWCDWSHPGVLLSIKYKGNKI